MRLVGELVPDYAGRPAKAGAEESEADENEAEKVVYLAKSSQSAAG
jgi:hypothetical protein